MSSLSSTNEPVLLFETLSHSVEDTEAVGKRLGAWLQSLPDCKGSFAALYGDLGAGKTAFVRGMAAVLTPEARVSSPTYAIVNEYRGEILFRHLDLYRITGEEDLYSIGYFDFLEEGIIAAEWCENIPDFLPARRVALTIAKTGENERLLRAELWGYATLPEGLRNFDFSIPCGKEFSEIENPCS